MANGFVGERAEAYHQLAQMWAREDNLKPEQIALIFTIAEFTEEQPDGVRLRFKHLLQQTKKSLHGL